MSGGSVYQLIRGGKKVRRDDGSYIWCVDYKDSKGKRVTKSTFRTKRDAEQFLEDTNVSVRAGTHTPDRDSITVSEACELWLADCEPHVERATFVKYEQHARLHIKPRLGVVKLSQLTRPDVLDFLSELRNATSDAMGKKVLASLKAIINTAMDKGRVAQNVALGVGNSTKRQKRTEAVEKRLKAGRDFPTEDELAAMLRLAAAPPEPTDRERPWPWDRNGNRELLATIAETGCRISELRGLAWEFVDLDRGVIDIERRADEWGTMGPPKSEAGARTIGISAELSELLKAWRERQAQDWRERHARRAKRGNGDDVAVPPPALVFPNGKGKPESVQNLYARFLHPLQAAARIVDADGEPKYGWHAFRHYRASRMIHDGADVVKVAAYLGHADATMTLRVYAHPIKEAERARLHNVARPEQP